MPMHCFVVENVSSARPVLWKSETCFYRGMPCKINRGLILYAHGIRLHTLETKNGLVNTCAIHSPPRKTSSPRHSHTCLGRYYWTAKNCSAWAAELGSRADLTRGALTKKMLCGPHPPRTEHRNHSSKTNKLLRSLPSLVASLCFSLSLSLSSCLRVSLSVPVFALAIPSVTTQRAAP